MVQLESSASGFLITFAGYLFIAVTAFLGVLVFFQRNTAWRLLAAAMFAITLPYFFFAGARNLFLAVVLPFILTYLFYGRHLLILKLAILAIAFFCLNEGFKFVIVFRGTGFREVLASKNPYELMDEDERHNRAQHDSGTLLCEYLSRNRRYVSGVWRKIFE